LTGPTPTGPDDLVVVGRVGKPHGIRGEVTVEVRTDAPEQRFAAGAVLRTEPPDRGPLVVEQAKDHSGRLVARFAGVEDRSAAEALRDTLLLVDVASIPPIDDPDEFHDWQLVGLRAELEDGAPVGAVVDVLHLPHGDVLVVEPDAAGHRGAEDGAATARREVLVPFVRAIVPQVDVAGGRVVLTPPEGLMDP
jgi:16S rRNA processing protein RimM